MGIQDLNLFLRKKTPRAFRRVKIHEFSGYRIAIDATLLLYSSFAAILCGIIANDWTDEDLLSSCDDTIRRKYYPQTQAQIKDRLMNFVNGVFLARDIFPIFVFDGKDIPAEKISGARERRKIRRNTLATKIQTLRNRILATEPLLRLRSDLDTLRNLYRQNPPIKPSVDFPPIREFLSLNMGVTVVEAPDEAEKFCAYLASTGVVAGSYTTDTDSYALGAPLVITDLLTVAATANDNYHVNRNIAATHFAVVVVPIILADLGFSKEQFVDLCIAFGCDFNTRMPGHGPSKIWKMLSPIVAAADPTNNACLLETASSLYPHLSWNILNAVRCREIFLSMDACKKTILPHSAHILGTNVSFHGWPVGGS